MCFGHLSKRVELQVGSWQLCMLKSYGSSGEEDEKSDKKKEEGKRRRTLANTVEVTVC